MLSFNEMLNLDLRIVLVLVGWSIVELGEVG